MTISHDLCLRHQCVHPINSDYGLLCDCSAFEIVWSNVLLFFTGCVWDLCDHSCWMLHLSYALPSADQPQQLCLLLPAFMPPGITSSTIAGVDCHGSVCGFSPAAAEKGRMSWNSWVHNFMTAVTTAQPTTIRDRDVCRTAVQLWRPSK